MGEIVSVIMRVCCPPKCAICNHKCHRLNNICPLDVNDNMFCSRCGHYSHIDTYCNCLVYCPYTITIPPFGGYRSCLCYQVSMPCVCAHCNCESCLLTSQAS